jgi:hypothetical protein
MPEPEHKGIPWTKLLTASGTICGIVYGFVAIPHARDPKGDPLLIMLSLIITLALWTLLVYAACRNFRDSRRASRLREVIEDLKEEKVTAVNHACADKLRELDKQRKDSEYPLLKSGKLHILAEDALWLGAELRNIDTENTRSTNPLDLSRPLAAFLICAPNTSTFLWQHCRLRSFRDYLSAHIQHAKDVGLAIYQFATG